MTEEWLRDLLSQEEDYNLEYKTARQEYSRKKLVDYCAAIANGSGGYLLLGVDDDKNIVGTGAFVQVWNKLANELNQNLGIRIKVYNIITSSGRVLVFDIPQHLTATPVQARKGGTGSFTYPIRDGESLVEMPSNILMEIFNEKAHDWSAQVTKGITMNDLDVEALQRYRAKWARHMKEPGREDMKYADMLRDIGLRTREGITNAAVLLFGKDETLSRYMPDAEIIFEWRNNGQDIPYGERRNWRQAFMMVDDEIWRVINARNVTFRYQEGFTQRDIPAYDEESVREAVVNAFIHRDYELSGRSVIVRVSPGEFYIENPGQLMPGVTVDNILERSAWRNRLLAESLEKVNISERSNQGMKKIFRHTVEAGKGLPLLRTASDPSVALTIPAQLQDAHFIKFLEAIAEHEQASLSLRDIIELEQIRRGAKHQQITHKDKLLEIGAIERMGSGRGSRYILAHKYYVQTGATGRHTRLAGLEREVKTELILKHIRTNGAVRNEDIQLAMPEMDVKAVSRLLTSMRRQGLIVHRGSKKDGYWHMAKENK